MKSRWEWRIKNPINLQVKTSKQINRALVIRPTQTI